MNKKLLAGGLVILSGLVVYLVIQNIALNRKLNEVSVKKEEVKITPVTPPPGIANPSGASPFDKPNVDPLANQFPPDSPKMPDITSVHFEKTVYDFGRIKEGQKVSTVFKFTNTGKGPLVITDSRGSCGCTVPQWPRHPVKAGGIDEIDVVFDSSGKSGQVEKTVTVTANTEPLKTVLTIKAVVVSKDK